MARASRTAEIAEPRSRKRLTPDQKAEIARAIAGGQTGAAIASRMGVSITTIYAQKRKMNPVASEAGPPGNHELRSRLASFALRTLLHEDVPAEERGALEREVREELVRRMAAGI